MIDPSTLTVQTVDIPTKASRSRKENPLLNIVRELHTNKTAGMYELSKKGSPSPLDQVRALVRRAAAQIADETSVPIGVRTDVKDIPDQDGMVRFTFWLAPKRGYEQSSPDEVPVNGESNRKRK